MSKVNISDKAIAISRLQTELEQLEMLQLKTGEKIAELLYDQVRLSEKTRAIMNTIQGIMRA